MKNFTFFWRYLALVVMLFGAVSVSNADTREISGSVTSTSDYLACGTTDVGFNLTFVSYDWEYGNHLVMNFPDGFTINSASTINGKTPIITGQQIHWPMYYYNSSGQTISVDFTINLSADGTVLGDQDANYTVYGDNWGSPPHSFSGVCVINEDPNVMPLLTVSPDPLDLGMWPIGAWQEPADLILTNPGSGVAWISASELDDIDRAFSLEEVDLPAPITNCGDPLLIGVGLDQATTLTDGVTYNATYVATWGDSRSVATADVQVTAYAAQPGDIFENPYFLSHMPNQPTDIEMLSSRVYNGFYKNYILPNDIGTAADDQDVVFEIDATQDGLYTVSITSGTTTNMAIYAGDFSGEDGPMATNALVQDLTNIVDFPMFKGTYYLVFSAHGDVTATESFVPMTAPLAAVYDAPADGAIDITNGTDLEWHYADAQTLLYQVVLGTTYPPADIVVDWTAAGATNDVYTLSGLEPNLQYFWQVNVKNNTGDTDGGVWGFTTTITPPQNLVAANYELFEGDVVELSWDNPTDKALLGYNVYRDGVMIKNLEAGTSYTDSDVALVRNMSGYDYEVTSVFDEGESGYSNMINVQFSGEGSISGNVSDEVTGLDIEGAGVDFVGQDEFGNTVYYSTTTNASGNYSVDAKVSDDYVGTAGYQDYEDDIVDPIVVVYNTITTQNFILGETPFPLAFVTATELNDDEVHLEWGFEARSDRAFESFDIYRGLWDDDFADMVYVGNTSQTQFIDYDWGTQTTGAYRWAVVVVYTMSESDPVYTLPPYLDKDMETVVNIEVTLNSAESPAGTVVTLFNTSEPYLDTTYTVLLGETGLHTFDPFRYGDYDVTVTLTGYDVITESVTIDDVTTLSYLLTEILLPVGDLYVNPNGYATWTSEGEVDNSIFFDFEDGMPDNFLVSDDRLEVTGGELVMTADGSASYASGYYDEVFSDFVFEFEISRDNSIGQYSTMGCLVRSNGFHAVAGVNGYAFALTSSGSYWWACKYSNGSMSNWTGWISTPSAINSGVGVSNIVTIEATGSTILYFVNGTLIHTVNDTEFSEGYCDVMAYDGGNGSVVSYDYYSIIPGAVAMNYDIAEGTNIQYEGTPEECTSISTIEGSGKLAKGVEISTSDDTRSSLGFRVWLDGVLSGETGETWWDYEVEETLVEGQEYLAEVAAMYTTGISDPMEYTFIYHGCTYFDGPSAVTAEVVVGTMDAMLTWTDVASSVTDDTITGVNVFRDGELIATVAPGIETYTDEQLESGDYEYCITNLYQSEAQSCEVCTVLTITPGGYVNGYVTDSVTGDPIVGAFVDVIGEATTFSFITVEGGYYEGDVVEGTYDYEVSSGGYETATLEDVFIDFGATVSNDFALLEFPYPVGNVVATEIDENIVLVDWSGGGGSIAEWLFYDDGANVDAIGGPGIFSWAIKFDPNQLTEYNGTSVTKIQVYARTSTANTLQIFEGSNASTLLFEQDLVGLEVDAWNEVELTNAVPIDITKELWITIYTTDGGSYPASCGAPQGEPNGDLITLDGSLWEHLTDFGLNYTWNLGCFVTDMTGKTVALGDVENKKLYKPGSFNPSFVESGVTNESAQAIRPNSMTNGKSTRDLEGFSVYRGTCEGAEMEFIGFTLDSVFTDNNWGGVEAGIYSWAVEAVYTDNVSEPSFSNCLDKDMFTEVTVVVATNSSDSPEGTDVLFINTSEIADPPYDYEEELDDTGVHTWTEFRKGTYDIFVHLDGYADIIVEGVEIWNAETFEFMLEEMLMPVADLYVSPTANATWRAGGAIPFEPFFEDFEGGELPEGWIMTTNSSQGWFFTQNGSSDWWTIPSGDGYYACSNDDMANDDGSVDYLITPMLDFSNNAAPLLSFSSFYTGAYSQSAYVEVSVDGSTWELVNTIDIGSSWTDVSVDLIDYEGESEVWIAFHADDNGSWASGWAVDNVAVTEGESRYAGRELVTYKVWLDGVFVIDTPDTFYQYDIADLVSGQEYYSEVAALYTTGMSAKMDYTWTYMSCDNYEGPEAINAEVLDVHDVLVTWGAIPPPPPPIVIIYETFEDYTAGGYLAEQAQAMGRDYWTTWSGTVGGSEDATVSDAYAYEGSNSAAVAPNVDAVLLLDTYTEGVINVDLEVYIPSGNTGYFNLMQRFGGAGNSWGGEIYFNPGGAGSVNASGTGTGSFTYTYDTWHHVYALIDLDADNAELYFNGDFIVSWVWSDGTGGNSLNEFNAMDFFGAASTDAALYDNISITMEDQSKSTKDLAIGSNLYREGDLIAEMIQDTFYLDMDLDFGIYDYCVTYVYESLAESCLDVCVEIEVDEDCVAPEELTAVLDDETYDAIYLLWDDNQVSEWLYYDDGVNSTSIGGPAEFIWAIKFDPDQLADLDGASVTKISVFCQTGDVNTLQIFEGANASTLLFEQDLIGLTVGAWNDVDLTSPVTIDVSKELWIGIYTTAGGAYPAACGAGMNEPNGDLISMDGSLWEHLPDYGLNYTWNLRAFVTTETAKQVQLGSIVNNNVYNSEGTFATTGIVNTSENAALTMDSDASRDFLGYNIYREGSLIEELWQTNSYTDTEGLEAGNRYCYEITSMFSYCGESDPSNEACTEMYVGMGELNENEVSLYPNPASNLVNVTSIHEMNRITVTNYVGQIVYVEDVSSTRVELNTDSYQAGVYLVKIETERGVITKRVIIRR